DHVHRSRAVEEVDDPVGGHAHDDEVGPGLAGEEVEVRRERWRALVARVDGEEARGRRVGHGDVDRDGDDAGGGHAVPTGRVPGANTAGPDRVVVVARVEVPRGRERMEPRAGLTGGRGVVAGDVDDDIGVAGVVVDVHHAERAQADGDQVRD